MDKKVEAVTIPRSPPKEFGAIRKLLETPTRSNTKMMYPLMRWIVANFCLFVRVHVFNASLQQP